jgi:hypothetical protein
MGRTDLQKIIVLNKTLTYCYFFEEPTTVQMYQKYTIIFFCYTDIPNVEQLGIHYFFCS